MRKNQLPAAAKKTSRYQKVSGDRPTPRRRFRPLLETLETRLVPAVRTWTGADGNLWSDALNWSGNVAPNPADDLVFPASVANSVRNFTAANDFTAGTNFNSITIQSGGYKLIGDAIDLATGVLANYTSGTSIDNLPATLHAATITVSAGAELDLGGAQGGTGGLTLSGSGTLALTGPTTNSYTGATTVNSGTLLLSRTLNAPAIPGSLIIGDGTDLALVQATADGQLGAGVNVTVNSSGTLDLNGHNDTIGALSLTGGAVTTGAGTLRLAGDVTTNVPPVTPSVHSTISGNLDLGGVTRMFTVADDPNVYDDLNVSANLSNGSVLKTGAGLMVLAGTNTYANTEVRVGEVQVQSNGALGTAGASTTQVDAGAAVYFAGASLNVPVAFQLTGTGPNNAGALRAVAGATTLTGNVTLQSSVQLDAVSGATLTLAGAIGDGSPSNGFGLTLTGPGTLVFGGSAANTYSGGTTVLGGTLDLSKTSAVAIPGNLTIGDGVNAALVQEEAANQINSTQSVVTVANAATFDLNNHNDTIGALTMTGSTVTTGTGTLTLGTVNTNSASQTATISGNLAIGGPTLTFNITDNPALDPDLSVSANISGTGAGITKGGANSQLLLSGNNTYDGATNLTAGVLEVASANALGATTAGTTVATGTSLALVGGVTLAAEPITINGSGFGGLGAIYNGNGTNTLTGPITLGSASSIGVAFGSQLTISGQITDGVNSFALTKSGTGTLVLTNANPYHGGTSINGGVVSISNGSALGTGTGTVASGAELDLSGGITLADNLSLSGTGVNNNGALRSVSGNNVYSGTATLTANATQVQVDAGQLDISGNIDDTGNHFTTQKTGSGLLLVSGNLTTTGAIRVLAGELRVTGALTGPATLDGGDISGTGTVGSIDQVAGAVGTVTPGLPGGTGILTTQGGYAVSTGATTHIDIQGTTAGTGYDQIANTTLGNVSLTGSTLQVAFLNGYIPAIGSTFRIIDHQNSGANIGTFNGLAEGATFQSGIVTFQISYVGGTGNDVTLTVTAVTYTWTGQGGDNNWSTGANWDAGTAPTAGSDLVFPTSAARLTNNNDLTGLSFHAVSIQGSGYQIGGNAITVTNGISATYSSGSSTFGLGTALTANETVNVATGGTLVLSGVVSGSGFGVTKTGAGMLEFTNSNSFTGNTTVSAGILESTNATGLGVAGMTNATVAAGAELDLSGAIAVQLNSLTLNGSGVNNAGALVLDGNVTVNTPTTLGSATTIGVSSGTPSYSQPIGDGSPSNGFNLTVVGGNPLTFLAPNTYTGTTFVTGSSLVLDASGGPAVAGPLVIGDGSSTAAEADYGADNQIGAKSVTVNGTNAVLNFEDHNDTIGGLTITGGTVALPTGGSASTVTASGLTLTGGTLLIGDHNTFGLGGNVTVNASPSGSVIENSGTGTLQLDNAATTFQVAAGPSGTDLNLSAIIGQANGVTAALTKTGTGTLALSGANTFTGGATINDGMLAVTTAGALGSGAATVNSGLGTSGELVLNLAGTNTLANALILNSTHNPAVENAGGTNTISGTVTLGTSATIDTASGTTLTLAGAIGDGGNTIGLSKTGTGTLVLSHANTYSGGTTASAGMLDVSNPTGLGTGAAIINGTAELVVVGGIAINNALTLNSTASPALTNSGFFGTLTGAITLGLNTVIGGSLAIDGAIGDGGHGYSLTVNDRNADISISSVCTYTGKTTVANGFLDVDGNLTASSEVDVTGGIITGGGGTGGTVGTVVVTGGTLERGNFPGFLTTGTVTLNSDSNLDVGLYSATAGTGYDQLHATGAVNLGGSSLGLFVGPGYTPNPGDQFTIIKNTSGSAITGTFAGLAEGAVFTPFNSPVSFRITYQGGASNQDVILTALANTTTTVTSSQNSPSFGQSVTFTATVSAVSGTPTGSVTFNDNGSALPNGTVSLGTVSGQQQATYTTRALTVGNHVITVAYTPTAASLFVASTGTLAPNPLVVSAASTTTQVSSTSSTTTTYGQTDTFTVLVTSANGLVPTGTVQFFDGNPSNPANQIGTGALNVLGIAALSTAGLHVTGSPHSINAVYVPGNGNFLASDSTGAPLSQTITPAPLTITADNQSKVYDGQVFNPANYTVKYSGFVNNDTLGALSGTLSFTGSATTAVNVGSSYTITAGGATDTDYTITFANGTLTITPAPLTVTVDNKTKVYGAALPTLTGTLLGVVAGDGISDGYGTMVTPTSDVLPGGYAITATLSDPNSKLANYTVTNTSGTLTITPANQTITWANPADLVYGTALSGTQLNATVSVVGPAAAGALTYAPATGAVLNAGNNQTLTVNAAATQDYSAASATVALNVTPAPLTVTANNQIKVYGAALPALTGTLAGVVNADGITASYGTAATATSDVASGGYAITATLGDPNHRLSNYTVTNTSGTLTITPANQTITWANPADLVYGTALSGTQLNATVSVVGPAAAGALTYGPAAGAVLNAGTNQTLTVNAAATQDYSAASATVALNVTPAPLTVTANNQTKVYGAALPTLTGTLAGVVNADGITASYGTAATATSDVVSGGYAITAALSDPNNRLGNYTVSNTPGTLTVTKASQTIGWATPVDIVYGTALGAAQLNATVSVVGPAAAGALTYAPAVGAVLNAGVGQTLSVTVAATQDYSAASTTVALNVTKAPLTVAANNQIKVYGAAVAALTGTLAGVVNNDGITASYGTAATAASDVVSGGYAITATLSDPNNRLGNYTVSNTPGVLTVTKASQTILWATPADIVYGTPLGNRQLNATVSVVGPAVAGALTYVPAAGAVLNAGTNQTLTVNAAATQDYGAASATVALNVTPAPLTVTANNQTKVYGAALPTLTGTLAGVVNADGITASYGTAATAASDVVSGGYAITATLGDPNHRLSNYTVTNTSGTLTVTPANQTITWAKPADIAYGTALSGTQLNATVSVVGPAAAGALTYGPAAGAVLNAGTNQTLTVNAAATQDYSVASATVALNVTPAPLTVTANNQIKVYGAALPTLTGTLAGVVNNDGITASYGTAATAISDVVSGGYAITATLNDPNSKLANYTVTKTSGTLTVTPASQTITWAKPADIVYGTALGAAQLKASVSVVGPAAAGALTYGPAAGAVLNAGNNQTLTVNAAATQDYNAASATVALTVAKAPLTVTANNQTKVFGTALPVLSGTLNGVVNGDGITATFSTTATPASDVVSGGYAITATLSDPNSRLSNYAVTTTPGILTVTPAATSTVLTSSANPSAAGQALTFTVAVSVSGSQSATPAGTVTLLDGTTVLGTASLDSSGHATFTTAVLTAGSHAISATYPDAGDYVGSASAVLTQTVTPTNRTPNQNFVAQVYLDLLQRPVEAGGLTFWTGLLSQGFSRPQVVLGIEGTPEYRTVEVQGLYGRYLHRQADSQGLAVFGNFLANGGTTEQVAAMLVGSPEYFAIRGGGTNAGFLNTLYQDALGRAIDPFGQASYTQALAHGTTPGQVAAALFGSAEYAQDLVQGYFGQYLHRPADPTGLDVYTHALQAGVRDEQVLATIIGSDEYYAR